MSEATGMTGTDETAVREITAQQPTPEGESKPGPALRAGAAVVAAALLGVGIGVGILKVRYGDPAPEAAARAAVPTTAPSASAGSSYGAQSNGTHFGSMRDLLLPVPDGYRLGPDAGAYGNDTELTDDQRKAWVDDQIRSLPGGLRDDVRKVWQDAPLKGGGVRSYADAGGGDFVITVWLLQYHQDAVKADNAFVGAMASDSGLFRAGPQVPGHQEAHCYLPSAPPGDKLDALVCSAAVGDLRVEAQVEGVAPLPKDKVVTLLRRQLDRLALPGASA
ncbi:hypothetical protein [Kitasatospora sp. HPMI-4]|uniref:hypothetical protein n=1 Tax=Kitasatospora sp. HPMI-4 TaxID=3448443 RepID=UPI003F1AD86E